MLDLNSGAKERQHMKLEKLIALGMVVGSSLVFAADPKPFGSLELSEATRLVTEKFVAAKGKEVAEGAISVTAQRTAKGSIVTVVYEVAGKGASYSLPCHQHKDGAIDCH